MHFTYLVGDTRIEQHTLRRRSLASVNMGHDANIAIALDRGCTGHDKILVFLVDSTGYQR